MHYYYTVKLKRLKIHLISTTILLSRINFIRIPIAHRPRLRTRPAHKHRCHTYSARGVLRNTAVEFIVLGSRSRSSEHTDILTGSIGWFCVRKVALRIPSCILCINECCPESHRSDLSHH